MKILSIFLFVLLLGSSCLGPINIVGAFSTTSTKRIQPAFVEYGHLDEDEVDYWWVLNVTEGDFVLVSIGAESGVWVWESLLYHDSNFTAPIDRIYTEDTHIHDFVANETGDYLLRLYTNYVDFEYTVECITHQVDEQLMYAKLGYLPDDQVDHWWVPDINKDDMILLSVCAESGVWVWESLVYDPEGEQIDRIYTEDTHIHELVANETGDYLLVLSTSYTGFNYTLKCNHPIGEKEETITKFSIEPNPAIVGQTVLILGNLTTSEGIPVPGEQVTIKSNGTARAKLTTNSTGWFKASGRVRSAGTFNLTVEYAGSPQYLPSSDWEILVVNKAQSWIYAIFTPNPVYSGDDCELRGILVDQYSNPIRYATVTVEVWYDSKYAVGMLRTNSYGIFSATFTAPYVPRIYRFRISYAGSQSYEACVTDIPLIVQ
jgi:hypothetical protein